MVEHSVVVMSARLNPMGSQFSIPLFSNLCSESVGWGGGWGGGGSVEASNNGGPSSMIGRKPMRGREKALFLLIFVLWWCLNRQWMRGGAVG